MTPSSPPAAAACPSTMIARKSVPGFRPSVSRETSTSAQGVSVSHGALASFPSATEAPAPRGQANTSESTRLRWSRRLSHILLPTMLAPAPGDEVATQETNEEGMEHTRLPTESTAGGPFSDVPEHTASGGKGGSGMDVSGTFGAVTTNMVAQDSPARAAPTNVPRVDTEGDALAVPAVVLGRVLGVGSSRQHAPMRKSPLAGKAFNMSSLASTRSASSPRSARTAVPSAPDMLTARASSPSASPPRLAGATQAPSGTRVASRAPMPDLADAAHDDSAAKARAAEATVGPAPSGPVPAPMQKPTRAELGAGRAAGPGTMNAPQTPPMGRPRPSSAADMYCCTAPPAPPSP